MTATLPRAADMGCTTSAFARETLRKYNPGFNKLGLTTAQSLRLIREVSLGHADGVARAACVADDTRLSVRAGVQPTLARGGGVRRGVLARARGQPA